MEGMVKNLLEGAVGLARVVGWWTLRGPGEDSSSETASQIPATVWDGGGGTLTIRVSASSAAKLHLSFSENSESDDARMLEVWEPVAAGSHEWNFDVPPGVSGYVDFGADAPSPGDTLAWTVEVNGAMVDEQSETLEQPLPSGYGFGLQTYFDDHASGTLGEGWNVMGSEA